ncbi:HET-domain-containing protein [Corynespora cassiicola Philippines]|uniref:HET-domain-containing protein n=1 Tax=Corynespora cassiicola Philippines TaxID=1448308 RepID=A0A2T2ND08_CORCC|nr:HET-domain-containing protein [Corynespora cassiicola Philippines]
MQDPNFLSAAGHSSYPGQPLADDSIRLIRLRPGPWPSPIRCDLFQVSLKDKPQYKALSYVWGSKNVTRNIYLNRRLFAITVNLESALRHLRHPSGNESLILWIDALCINQDDLNERTRQVKLMGRIYRSCIRVIVYLGNQLGDVDSVESGQGLEKEFVDFSSTRGDLRLAQKVFPASPDGTTRSTLQPCGHFEACRIFALMQILDADSHLREIPLFKDTAQESEESFESSDYQRSLFETLRMFMHPPWTPWWSRIWVIQEIVFPKDVSVTYGRLSADWDLFASAAKGYLRHSTSCCSHAVADLPRDLTKVLTDFSTRIQDIENLRLAIHHPDGEKYSLLTLLKRFQGRKASDARDKVYALLSLAEAGLKIENLSPDYSLDVVEVYTKATFESILSTRSLSVFNTDLSRKFRTDLPSWVPDWESPGAYNHHLRTKTIELYNGVPFFENIGTAVKLQQHTRILNVKGIKRSIILANVEVMWGDSAEACAKTIQDWWLVFARELKNPEKTFLAFCKLLCGDVLLCETVEQQVVMRRTVSRDSVLFAAWKNYSKRSPFRDSNLSMAFLEGSPVHDRDFHFPMEVAWGDLMQKVYEDSSSYNFLLVTILESHASYSICDWRASWEWTLEAHRRGFIGLALMVVLATSEDYHSTAGRLCKARAMSDEEKDDISQSLAKEVGWWADSFQGLLDTMSSTVMKHAVVSRRSVDDMVSILEEVESPSEFMLRWTHLRQGSWMLDWVNSMDHSIMTATLSRGLIRTVDGFGLGPANARSGDGIFLLQGGRTPFILRRDKVTGYYRVVGDCYLQDVMDWDEGAAISADVGWGEIHLV